MTKTVITATDKSILECVESTALNFDNNVMC